MNEGVLVCKALLLASMMQARNSWRFDSSLSRLLMLFACFLLFASFFNTKTIQPTSRPKPTVPCRKAPPAPTSLRVSPPGLWPPRPSPTPGPGAGSASSREIQVFPPPKKNRERERTKRKKQKNEKTTRGKRKEEKKKRGLTLNRLTFLGCRIV